MIEKTSASQRENTTLSFSYGVILHIRTNFGMHFTYRPKTYSMLTPCCHKTFEEDANRSLSLICHKCHKYVTDGRLTSFLDEDRGTTRCDTKDLEDFMNTWLLFYLNPLDTIIVAHEIALIMQQFNPQQLWKMSDQKLFDNYLKQHETMFFDGQSVCLKHSTTENILSAV